MTPELLIKIATIVAFLGLSIVVGALLLGLAMGISVGTKNTLMLIGFAMMFLGTLWKVVLEMNSPEE